ncbi:hypothetical protein IAF28_20565, partial [Acinetobacter baumannii]|nr:hypothetical protein [Acinetobacter baumannii]
MHARTTTWTFVANLLDVSVPTVHEKTLKDALDKWDIIRTEDPDVYEFYRSSPG